MTHALYFAPGACSLAPNIVLREAGIPFDLVRVDLRQKKLATGESYLAINPNGYVPALRLPDGSVLTEAAVMLQYIADQRPEAKLAPPPAGTMERYRFQEKLNFIATELHKGTSPLYNPAAGDDFKAALKARLASRFEYLASFVRDGYIMGGLTAADGYAFYILRSWQHAHKEDLTRWPALVDYYQRMAVRPAVVAALASEGLQA